MNRRNAFNEIARVYDEIRPSYPEALIQDVIAQTNLSAQSQILEIGAGTGKATVQFAQKGLQIHCIEPAQNMADLLIEKCSDYPGVTVDVARFEDWNASSSESFDLIICAQAFHWIDPEVRYQKCHQLLKESGSLALLWYQPSDSISKMSPETKAMLDEINELIVKHSPNFFQQEDAADVERAIDSRESELASSGLFDQIEKRQYSAETMQTAEDYVKAINSYSKFSVLEDEVKQKINAGIFDIINRRGGRIGGEMSFSLYLAKKINSPAN